MRSVGLGLAMAATVQFVLVSTPAFAQPPAPATDPVTSTPVDAAKDAQAGKTTDDKAADKKTKADAAVAATVATPGKVTVHIQSSRPVTLERRAPGHEAWESVCTSPCDQALASSDEYHVVGGGLNDSHPFFLDTTAGDKVTLDVRPGSKNKQTTGKWLLVGGGVLLVGGVVTILAGSSDNAAPGANGTTTTDKNNNVIFIGTALIVSSVILGITGGSFILDNAHTKVDGAVQATSDSKGDNSVGAKVTASRLPTWHEDRGPVPTTASTIFPIIDTKF